jgi:hypothetical protein
VNELFTKHCLDASTLKPAKGGEKTSIDLAIESVQPWFEVTFNLAKYFPELVYI